MVVAVGAEHMKPWLDEGDLGPRRRSVDGIGQTVVNLEAPRR